MAQAGVDGGRLQTGAVPTLVLADGSRRRLEEFREPWRVPWRRSQAPPESVALVEAVGLRSAVLASPAPTAAVRIRGSFLVTALLVVATVVVALALVGVVAVIFASGPVAVNPSTLPVGHHYDVYVTQDGQVQDQVSCPAPLSGMRSPDPVCRHQAHHAMAVATITSMICGAILALEAWYLVRRRARTRALAPTVDALPAEIGRTGTR